jgi:hypothetical protein
MVKRSILILALAACGKFEDPDIVIDLRPISIAADRPEQVVTVDAMSQPTDILAQLKDTVLTVVISDLNFERGIRWSAEVCYDLDDDRCDHDSPYEMLGSGTWDDPDLGPYRPYPTLTIPADGNLLGILVDELDNDALHGLGGLTFNLSLRIGGVDADPSLDQFLTKQMMVSPAIPAGRLANHNPTLDGFDAQLDGGEDFVLPTGRCGGPSTPVLVAPGQTLRIEPIENVATRETYQVPAIDGTTRTFTEAVTYQWLATGGKFSSGNTGGGHDAFGNLQPTHTDWTAPKVDDAMRVSLWIIQRDERLGVTLWESCVVVQPPR